MQRLWNDSKSLNVGRLYFADTNYFIHDTPTGKRLTLRNGNKDVKTTNRITRMCGLRKDGPLRTKGDVQYYKLKERDNGKKCKEKRQDFTYHSTRSGDPTFQFTGVWTAGMFERMYHKAARALRQSKVRMAQEAQAQATRDSAEAEKAANITLEE